MNLEKIISIRDLASDLAMEAKNARKNNGNLKELEDLEYVEGVMD